jgi:probable phosphoglycerate mutase
MSTTRLLLVRHGHSQHHVQRVAGGPRGDTGLTDTGREQVQKAAARLAAAPALAGAPVYCSTLARARQTGELLATALGSPPPVEHCGLCSYHVLDRFDGRPHTEQWASARRGGGIPLWRSEHEGGDTFGALVARAAEAYLEIAERHHGETVVIATHNETVQASLVALGDLPYRHRLNVTVSPASITEWSTEGDTTAGGPADDWAFIDWKLVRLNDTGHLEAGAA